MRTFDVAYVKNTPTIEKPVPPFQEMDLRTLTKTYIVPCVKSNGLVSNCRKCDSKCVFGKRALELAYGEGDMVKPLLNQGILDRMRAEKAKEETKEEKKPKKPRGRMLVMTEAPDWYVEAGKQEDPSAYIASLFNITLNKAKQKVYAFRHDHKDLVENLPVPVTNSAWKIKVAMEKQTTKPAEEPEKKPEKEPVKEVKTEYKPEHMPEAMNAETVDDFVDSLRKKVDLLLKEREFYKQEAERFTKLYEGIKDKVDALTMCIDTFSGQ